MNTSWEFGFRKRLDSFRSRQTTLNGIPISIKIRVTSGCFHREHSPQAYRLIDAILSSTEFDSVASFEEHESGPEILVYVALGTAVISLTANVINLVTTIIKARSDGIKKGDRPSEPLELVVRTVDLKGGFIEEQILHINSSNPPDTNTIEETLNHAVNRMLLEAGNKKGARRITGKTTTLTRSKKRVQTKGKKQKSSLNARRRKK